VNGVFASTVDFSFGDSAFRDLDELAFAWMRS
jgi:hypothetical protein